MQNTTRLSRPLSRLLNNILLHLAFLSLLYCPSFASAATDITSSTAADKKTTHSSLIPPPRRSVPGFQTTVSIGQLYVPDFFKPADTTSTDVMVFFLGASWVAQQNFYDAHKNAVLVSVSLRMEEYGKVFTGPSAIHQLLDAVQSKLADENITTKPLGRICLASFSGGYSAVRALLEQDELVSSVSDVLLADSLYGDHTTYSMEDKPMVPFLKFARLAADGKRTMWFTQLFPPEEKYRTNTTTLAANYLIDHLNLERRAASGVSVRGAKILYRAEKGNLHIIGYAGMTTQDHFEHFYGISDLFKETSFADAH